MRLVSFLRYPDGQAHFWLRTVLFSGVLFFFGDGLFFEFRNAVCSTTMIKRNVLEVLYTSPSSSFQTRNIPVYFLAVNDTKPFPSFSGMTQAPASIFNASVGTNEGVEASAFVAVTTNRP